MEDPIVVIVILVGLSVGVGLWADSYGRNGWLWGILSMLISPLIIGIALLIAGKTIEEKAAEAKRIRELSERL